MNDFDIVEPLADSLMESLRATGYALPDAVADLIDNSVVHSAKNIWLRFYWAGSDSSFYLWDDGEGMTEEKLKDAMRVGSRNPTEVRHPSDLGRYGLGLKTASISQARSVTVATKIKDSAEVSVRRWDLDHIAYVKEWQLLRSASPDGQDLVSKLSEVEQGTIVFWEKLDRLVGDCDISDNKVRQAFLGSAQSVEKHIAMVFHRFMEGPKAVSFWITDSLGNNQSIRSWDPFMSDNIATQRLPSERIGGLDSGINVSPFILPHHTRLTAEQHTDAGGPAGWNAHQGFYVYRNRRLLLAGDWLGLGFVKEEHYKLARIQIDLPNSVDQEWEIDVRKSSARPPISVRDELVRIARATRNRAVTVYRNRGKVLARSTRTSPIFVWQRQDRNQGISYVINRGHPLVREVVDQGEGDTKKVRRLLRLIEEYVPVQQIWLDSAQSEKDQNRPFESTGQDEILDMIQWLYAAFRNEGLSHDDAVIKLGTIEGFGDRFEFIELAMDRIVGEHS